MYRNINDTDARYAAIPRDTPNWLRAWATVPLRAEQG